MDVDVDVVWKSIVSETVLRFVDVIAFGIAVAGFEG